MKRVASTSRFACREMLPTLQPRERDVLAALRIHVGERREWPTAYELLERMRVHRSGFDVNSIRPRLTSLRDKGLIVGDAKRRCRVTGRIAWTWATTDAEAPPVSHPDDTAARRQSVLDLNWGGGGL